MAEAFVTRPKTWGANTIEAEAQAEYVEALARSYVRRAKLAAAQVDNGLHPRKDGTCISQLHEHAKMLRREILTLDKMTRTW